MAIFTVRKLLVPELVTISGALNWQGYASKSDLGVRLTS